MKQYLSRHAARALVACALAAPFSAFAQTTFSVSFVDPGNQYTARYADITNSITAAGNQWLSQFSSGLPATTLTISVTFSNISTLNGTSNDWSYVDTRGGTETYQAGALQKVATGEDSNGAATDIAFGVGFNYMNNVLWFGDSSQAVPAGKVDAVSAFAHEFGHAWGFNGFRDWTTGSLSTPYQSTYDSFVQIDNSAPGGTTLYFIGPRAMEVYGGRVPLTYGNYAHLANRAPRDGSDLLNDLMNGVAFAGGRRYGVSELDMAILADLGAPVLAVPEPAAVQLMLAGLAMGLLWRRRRETA